MSVYQSVDSSRDSGRTRLAELCRFLVAPASQLLAALFLVLCAYLSWAVWQSLPFAIPSSLELHLRLGFAGAALAAFFSVLRGEHRLAFYAAGENSPMKTARTWSMAAAGLLLMAFLSRQADEISRGTVILFFVSGYFALLGARDLTARALRVADALKIVVAQRLLVVGTRDGIATFLRRYRPWTLGFSIVGTVEVEPIPPGVAPEPPAYLQRAIDLARSQEIDDVYVAVPWSDTQTIDLCVEALMNVPVTLHLAPEQVLDRFEQVTIARVGPMSSLELTRPMSAFGVFTKRIFDLVLSAAGLLVLAPLFALVALAVRLDSPGPVFFMQTRYGFNQRAFRIVKFRTMAAGPSGGFVQQASRNDPRVTSVGRWLRRTNIDELPQLLNVLAGDMSLVGPRPHAVPHNRTFERRIELYARRHNVRPGITGWAQVHGLRGETDTDAKMAARVEYDLFYIDNWSMLLDLEILVRTVFSRKAYRNAY